MMMFGLLLSFETMNCKARIFSGLSLFLYSLYAGKQKKKLYRIVTEIALSLDGMKCDAAMRGVVLAVLLIGHAAAGSREQVQSAL